MPALEGGDHLFEKLGVGIGLARVTYGAQRAGGCVMPLVATLGAPSQFAEPQSSGPGE